MSKRFFLTYVLIGAFGLGLLASPLLPWIPADLRPAFAFGSLSTLSCCSYSWQTYHGPSGYVWLLRIGAGCLFGTHLLDRMSLPVFSWIVRVLALIAIGWATYAYLRDPAHDVQTKPQIEPSL